MKQYIVILYTSIPRYFEGQFIYNDHCSLYIEIEWTKHIQFATRLAYEEACQLKSWCDEYRNEQTQILDTSLEIVMQP